MEGVEDWGGGRGWDWVGRSGEEQGFDGEVAYGPLVPAEILEACRRHAAVAANKASDPQALEAQSDMAQDRLLYPHRYAPKNPHTNANQGGGGGGEGKRGKGGSEKKGGGGQEREEAGEWKPVRERFFHDDLKMVMSGLPEGQRYNTAPAPLDRYCICMHVYRCCCLGGGLICLFGGYEGLCSYI